MAFTISQVAEQTGVAAFTLRFYEKEGLIFGVARDENGRRQYTPDNVELIKVIECLKETGMSIREIKAYIHLFEGGAETYPERTALFQARCALLQSKIDLLEQQKQVAIYKMWYYENVAALGDVTDPLNCQKMRVLYDAMQAGATQDRQT